MGAPILAVEAVDQVLDEVAISHLDFDLVCQVGITPVILVSILGFNATLPVGLPSQCAAPAVALLRATCCTFEATICAKHRDEILAGSTTSCGVCGAMGPTSVLVTFHPLPGVR